MSLISLSSKSVSRNDTTQQSPFNFKNFFPQPIVIRPRSQVCLTTFYHFRIGDVYNISENNNLIGFNFGDRRYNNVMFARLKDGNYEGNDLATEIQRAMNAANVQQNYQWVVTFTLGNELANPPEQTKFTIRYLYVDTPTDFRGGNWNLLPRNTQGILLNDDIDDQESSLVNITDLKLPALLRNGLLLHEGYCEFLNLGYTVDSEDNLRFITPVNMGFINSSMSVESNNLNLASTFNADFGDILVRTRSDGNGNLIEISTLKERQGSFSAGGIFAPENKGKAQKLRRRFANAFVSAILPDRLHRFSIKIVREATTRSFVVILQQSTDGGVTYGDVADGVGGNNADGEPNVYSQTIGNVNFTSVIYCTIGVGSPVVKEPTNNLTTKSDNQASNIKAPFIPFIQLNDRLQEFGGLDLSDSLIQLSILPEQGTPPLVPDNQFVMGFEADMSGNGYNYYLYTLDVATTPSAQINSTLLADMAIGNLSISGEIISYEVFADNTSPIVGATKIADLEYNVDADDTAYGNWTFKNWTAGAGVSLTTEFLQLNFIPTYNLTNTIISLRGLFNSSYNPITMSNGLAVTHDAGFTNRSHWELGDDEDETEFLPPVNLGADLLQPSYLILGRPNKDTLAQFNTEPIWAGGNPAAKLPPLQRFGNTFKVLGFSNVINSIDQNTTIFESDTRPLIQDDETSIHISIPELSGIVSYEGEAENTGKTIKVIPKNEFTESSTSGSMTYTAPFEEWIDINNAESIVLNEMTIQVRKPDGTMATNLKPITRCTVKLQEDPEIKKITLQRELIEAMQSTKAQAQNTGQIQFVDANAWTGS